MTHRTFDYTPGFDVRNVQYPVAPFATTGVSDWKHEHRYWWKGPVLDQGAEGACVGFGWTAELGASPQRVKFTDPNQFARDIYRTAQTVDQWPGEDYEGTSVLAGAKVVQSFGLMDTYRWAFSVDEIRQTILHVGPVVIGLPWYDSMYETRPSGLVESLSSSDRLVGGHCLLINGYSPRYRFVREGLWKRYEIFRWQNSWGPSYGRNGHGYIRAEDLDWLFSQYGEACVPMGRKNPGKTI